MRKKIALLIAIVAILALGAIACGNDTPPAPDPISLGFDGASAYFTGAAELAPISGDEVSATDVTETATVKITASREAKMRLTLTYAEGSGDITGLKVVVGGVTKDVADGTVLYESAEKETSATVEVTFYLDKNATVEQAGKQLKFKFTLSYEEE